MGFEFLMEVAALYCLRMSHRVLCLNVSYVSEKNTASIFTVEDTFFFRNVSNNLRDAENSFPKTL